MSGEFPSILICLLGGSLIVNLVNRAGKLNKFFSEILITLFVSDLIFDIPKFLIGVLGFF